MFTPCIHENTQEIWVTVWQGPSHHLKCHLQLQRKDVRGKGTPTWEVIRQSTINWRYGDFSDLNTCLLHWYLSRFSHPSPPGTGRKIPLQMEISLINVNVSYKRVTSTGFHSFSRVCCFLKITSHNPYAKEAFFVMASSAPLQKYVSVQWSLLELKL